MIEPAALGFRHFLTSSNESNAYIVWCGEEGEALLVDAGAFAPAMADFLEQTGLRLRQVFITHDHYDHTGDLNMAVARYGAEVLAARNPCGGCPTKMVRHGDTVRVGRREGHVLATPGHTPDSLSLALPGMVFTGDALFAGSVGGTGSSADAARQIQGIRTHLFSLPAETIIYPGHGPASTVEIESRFNPFFV